MKGQPTTGYAYCPIDKFVPLFPSGQNTLVAPSNPKFLGLAFGTQNYTCSSSNNYTSTGAVAELIDASCLAFVPEFSTIQEDMYNVWTTLIPQPIQSIIDLLHFLNPPTILAQHFFQTNPVTGQGVSPVWDFRSNPRFKGNNDVFVLAKGKGSIPAPTDPKKDVAWLDVVNVQGKIADEVFRFDTVGGQPPATCKYGYDKDISVKYVSKYIFYGGSINYS
ncbi:hypothetical protein DICSQDRAFT_64658 [Dichomitus squalens LYAD-421 SS1]|uniref:Malate dehydrogenase n=2 Tax=Dichomitus squalens TaxID=114155 RepID=A0A4V2K6L3_9APHY|nr:uncharacterized protein DICSQDRAFT_64658 [Dichomitus squalens LYAD-421 SS1]EJF59675.1 hypothetical protein DICSQDRAFT_64658 [Dichomitus squalens LYAD-421 SS1]TBU52683.1 hypothetical protein BD310DRAFT_831736 [Dichomitus squalens]